MDPNFASPWLPLPLDHLRPRIGMIARGARELQHKESILSKEKRTSQNKSSTSRSLTSSGSSPTYTTQSFLLVLMPNVAPETDTSENERRGFRLYRRDPATAASARLGIPRSMSKALGTRSTRSKSGLCARYPFFKTRRPMVLHLVACWAMVRPPLAAEVGCSGVPRRAGIRSDTGWHSHPNHYIKTAEACNDTPTRYTRNSSRTSP